MEYLDPSSQSFNDRVDSQLMWNDLSVLLNGSRKQPSRLILNKARGYVRPGEFLVIMGPSGAGKTTLLNVLSQRNLGNLKITEGEIALNKCDIESIDYKSIIGFVPQDDILIELLTPRETFSFTAELTLNIPKHQRYEKVENLIAALGLSSCADTKIGGRFLRGISGGERKRTSIGVELISDPPILFLDEPTTGLDSFTAESIIKLINNQAKIDRRTVISTIHQPSSQIFSQFDRLLLLSKGETVYFGKAEKAVSYFERMGFPVPKNFNPSDHYMSVLSKENTLQKPLDARIRTLSASFAQNFKAKPTDSTLAPRPHSGVTYIHKMKTLLYRALLVTVRNPLVIRAKIGKVIPMVLIMLALFWGISTDIYKLRDRDGALYLSMFVLIYEGLQIQSNRPVFLREYSSRKYDLISFYLSYNLVNFPTEIFVILFFSSAVYWPLGLNSHPENFFKYMLVLLLCSITGSSYGILVSSLADSTVVALGLSSVRSIQFFHVPLMLAGGFMIDNDQLADWYVIKYISTFRYGYEALVINEYDNLDGLSSKEEHDYVQSKHFSETYAEACGILISLSVIIRILAFFILKLKTRHI